MGKKGFLRLTLIGLSILLAITIVSSANSESPGSLKARLGGEMSRVMLHWPLMVLQGPKSYPLDQLGSSLDNLEGLSGRNDLPDFLTERISSLKSKLGIAQKKDLWKVQPGYWSFTRKDPSLSLSGASISEEVLLVEREDGGSITRKIAMKYLSFPEKESKVDVDLEKQLLSPPLESFTIEFWIRPKTQGTGNILIGGNWTLSLTEDRIKLIGPSGSPLILGDNVPTNYWTHLSLTSNGEQAKLYRNGILIKPAKLPSPLTITRYLTLGEGFVGNFDELRVNSKAVGSEYLNFDRPMNYLLGFPFINWVGNNFSPDELWSFYGGWLVTNLSLKRENEKYSITPDDLVGVADFLLGKIEGSPSPPGSLSEQVLDNLERLRQLGKSEELSPEDRSEVGEVLSGLVNFFDLR